MPHPTHFIPINLAERSDVFLTIRLVFEEVEEVSSPLFRSNTLSIECLDVILHVWQEVVEASNRSFKVEKEV